MDECCATCRKMKKLVQFDYSQGGCNHTDMDGYVCLVFVGEGEVVWMVGEDAETGMCECYEPKEG